MMLNVTLTDPYNAFERILGGVEDRCYMLGPPTPSRFTHGPVGAL